MLVVCEQKDGPYREVAEEIAADIGGTVVESVDGSTSGLVYYVADPAEIDRATVLDLQKRMLDRGPTEAPFGVITGYTPESALDLYRREPRGGDRHWITLRKQNSEVESPDPETTVLGREETTVDRFSELVDEPVASMSMMNDGRTIHAILTDGFICGYPSSVPASEYDGPYPNCIESDGTRDCHLADEDDLISADELMVDDLFLCSCSKILTGEALPFENSPDAGFPIHVGMGMLENARSVIGTYRVVPFEKSEVALHYALRRAGYTSAQRCYVLNRNAEATGLKDRPYVLFGQPTVAAENPPEQRYELSIDEDAPGELTVTASSVDAHVIDITLPEGAFPDTDQLIAERRTESERPLYYSAFREGDQFRLIVYSWGRLTDSVSLRVSNRSAIRDEYEILSRSYENLRTLGHLGLLDQKADGQLNNLENQVNSLSKDIWERRFDAGKHEYLSERFDAVRNELAAVQRRLVSILRNREYGYLADDYIDNVGHDDVGYTESKCHKCGRRLFVKQMSHPLTETKRVVGQCPKCITVFDVPKPPGTEVRYPEVVSETTYDDRGVHELEVSFENQLEVPADAVAFPWLYSFFDSNRGADVFDPESTEVRLAPGESTTFEFEVDTTDLDSYHNRIYVYVISNLDVHLSVIHLDVEDW